LARATVNAVELCRLIANVTPWGKGAVEVVRLRLDEPQDGEQFPSLSMLASDNFTAGEDRLAVSSATGIGTVAYASTKGLEALATAVRASKPGKNTAVVFELDDRGLTLCPPGTEVPVSSGSEGANKPNLWPKLDELFDYTVDRPASLPVHCMINPEYLARLNKVRSDRTDRMADFEFGGEYEPVLVKIGPSFRAVIQPIDRQVHADNVGEDGLW
jgi:hypothetical protein